MVSGPSLRVSVVSTVLISADAVVRLKLAWTVFDWKSRLTSLIIDT